MHTFAAVVLAGLLAAFALPASAVAQEAEKPAPERPKTALERTAEVEDTQATAQELFAAAIQRLRGRKEFVVQANVEHQQPKIDPAKPAAPGQAIQVIVRAQGMGAAEDPFEGKVEAWRDANGVSIIVSEKKVPGFGLYLLQDKTIRRVTYEAKAPGLSQLQAELLSLLDGQRFVRHVLAAELGHRVDEATGDHLWSGKISRDIVRPARAVSNDLVAMMAMRMTPRVLRANVELRLSKEGKLKQTRVTIVRNDPAREMLQGGFAGRVIIRGGGGNPIRIPQPGADGDKEKHEVEGVSTIYTLDLTATQASERAKAFKRDMQRAVGK